MSREVRVDDNWALLYAQQLAIENKKALVVIFNLVPKFLEAAIRGFDWILQSAKEVETKLMNYNIPMKLLIGLPANTIPLFCQEYNVSAMIADHNPLRVTRQWKIDVSKKLKTMSIPLFQVDAHNVVPVWVTSPKLEYAARTIRPKIHQQLSHYLTEFPAVIKQEPPNLPQSLRDINNNRNDWQKAYDSLEVDRTITLPSLFKPGEQAGKEMLSSFLNHRIIHYDEHRNDPNKKALSDLSPYFHFGNLAPQRAILEAKKHSRRYSKSVEVFVEEALVRRELSDNYCYYNNNYDNLRGAPDWAQKTLNDHRNDHRDFLYTLGELEAGVTHDDLWNAAQLQMVRDGKMHGYIRMYWAKKILEWTESPEQALEFSIYLNDRFSIDGRDSNGYVGCGWAICGIHDQGWAERNIFGKIRYMNYEGCKRKFDVNGYVRQFPGSVPNSIQYQENQKKAKELNQYYQSIGKAVGQSRQSSTGYSKKKK